MKQPPATNNELTLDASAIIVIRTSVNGIITYVNDEFVKISGYHEQEAIGQHLGFILHPSMPSEIFSDVWKTLGLTHPWSGVVKNIAKSGDYFWSHTNVITEFSHGIASNYLFVSYAPKNSELEKAKMLYDDIKNKSISLEPSVLTGFLNFLKTISFGKKTAFSLTGVLAPSSLVCYELLMSHSY